MIVYGKRPYTYILYDNDEQCDYLRLAATDWYSRLRSEIDWISISYADQLTDELEEKFLKLGLECGQS